jgi:hypothetical protein
VALPASSVLTFLPKRGGRMLPRIAQDDVAVIQAIALKAQRL